jgi:hypothetical protein
LIALIAQDAGLVGRRGGRNRAGRRGRLERVAIGAVIDGAREIEDKEVAGLWDVFY